MHTYVCPVPVFPLHLSSSCSCICLVSVVLLQLVSPVLDASEKTASVWIRVALQCNCTELSDAAIETGHSETIDIRYFQTICGDSAGAMLVHHSGWWLVVW